MIQVRQEILTVEQFHSEGVTVKKKKKCKPMTREVSDLGTTGMSTISRTQPEAVSARLESINFELGHDLIHQQINDENFMQIMVE